MGRNAFDEFELTGRSSTHVVDITSPRCTLHRGVVPEFLRMRAAAARSGIDLVPVSSFRDFRRQVDVWNAKWNGQRPVLDTRGRPLNPTALSPAKRIDAILTWSAAPGLSRHHWGTEIDVYDRAAVPEDYRLQLVPDEYSPEGPFAKLSAWLDANILRFGFFRPYATFRGGVQPEPWHLSHARIAREASRRLRVTTVARAIASGNVAGADVLLKKLPEVYARLRCVDLPRKPSL